MVHASLPVAISYGQRKIKIPFFGLRGTGNSKMLGYVYD